MTKLENKYRESLYDYLNQIIDFEKYDKMIDESNLYFGESNDIVHNISSKYFTVLNDIYLDKLSEDVDENSIDIDFVKRTYVDVLKKRDGKINIMYNPPMLEHVVKDGSLVIEFVYGKDTVSLSNEQYVEHVKKQRKFIKEIIEQICNEVKEKIGLECSVFVSKRVRI